MKRKILFVFVISIFAISLIAAFGMNRSYSTVDNQKTSIQVELKEIARTNDHVAIEYVVHGKIETPDGIVTECPVGSSSVLNNASEKIPGSDNDFVYCRPDGNGNYIVTQFFYSDYRLEKNNPKKVKITIGDVDTAINGKAVHVPPVGDYSFDLPAAESIDSVSYPTDISQAQSGLKMKVSRVDFSPSLAKVDACVTLPDPGDWVFDAYLLNNGQKLPFEYWSIQNFRKQGSLDNRERCYSVIVTNIPDYKTFKKGELSFVIEKISRNMPDCVNAADYSKIKDELEKYGVTGLKPDDTGSYCFASSISGMEPDVNAHLNSYIREALKEEVDGPLTIVIK